MFFSEAVKVSRSACIKCYTFIYNLPARLDADIASYLTSFGEPELDLRSIKLLKISTPDNYRIEGKLDTTIIKLAIPKELERGNPECNTRKGAFEQSLCEWLSKKLDIPIRPDPKNFK